jgi:EmrB/QacA subfamily drug resistance transporter
VNKQQRLVLIISILSSFVAFLDGSVVNVALPAIMHSLGGGLVNQQWVIDAYLLTLGSLILIAGSLSDIFGRKNILKIGLIGFGLTSLLCAIAPSSQFLIVCRAAQGVAGALLVPSSLALIISTFKKEAQGNAIGKWTAWTGISFLIGPLVGGILVDTISWRAIFIINIVPIAITLWLMRYLIVNETVSKSTKVDYIGAALCAFGLVGTVYSLIEQPTYGWSSPNVYIPLILGIVLLYVFIKVEKQIKDPMLSLGLFKIRNFSIGNLATVAIYAGLSIATFLIVITEQEIGHYSAFGAGLSLLPVTIIMFIFSPRFGALASKFGPRFFMSIGPLIAGTGFLLLMRVGIPMSYTTEVLPGVVILGLGLSITVAPLTSAVLGDIPASHAGVGSAVNNAVSRIAGLLSIATIGLVVGSKLTIHGFHKAVLVMAILVITGGVVSAVGITNTKSILRS